MQIEIVPRVGRGGTEFIPEPSRLHLGGQQAEGVDKLEFAIPVEWIGKDVSLYIEHSDGAQQSPVQLDENNTAPVDRKITSATSGRWMLVATDGKGYSAYTKPGTYDVYGTLATDGAGEDPSPSLYEQFVARVLESANMAQAAAKAAEESSGEAAGSATDAAKSAEAAAESAEAAAESEAAAKASADRAAASEPAGAADRAEKAAARAESAQGAAETAAKTAEQSAEQVAGVVEETTRLAERAEAAASESETNADRAENAAVSAAESAQAAQEYLSIAARTVVREIVIPAAGWATDETAPLALDVAVAGAEESQIPVVSLHPEALAGARDAGLYPVAQTREGAVRLWAKRAPAAELPATLILLSGGGAGGLPIATANTLGGVMIGENVNVTSDGKISVKDIPVPAAEGVMSEIVARAFSEN